MAAIFGVLAVLALVSLVVVAEARRSTVTTVTPFLGPVIIVGLLKYRDGWRICALGIALFGLVFLGFSAALTLSSPGATHVTGDEGLVVSDLPALAVMGCLAAMFAWIAWVLTRPPILRLFGNAVPEK